MYGDTKTSKDRLSKKKPTKPAMKNALQKKIDKLVTRSKNAKLPD